QGLFNFSYGPDDIVVECNPYCNCAPTCNNRVAQRPRPVPIELFKTLNRGWGIRSPREVKKGAVLGLHTGLAANSTFLRPRRDAKSVDEGHREHIFDLDYNDGDAPEDELFSVDSFECGNWTRFVNHSCSPNVRVQPIVYDTLPEQRIAFLAFIALVDITANTEFCIDYSPRAQGNTSNATTELDAAGGTKCLCESVNCRGQIYL
ncbi:hypothetical protein R3P38DRAFT_2581066, partial [Favolaschia claudopus]